MSKTSTSNNEPGVLTTPKFPRPKILLIDAGSDAADALRRRGYNVAVGSFGSRYRVEKSGGFRIASPRDRSLPEHTEQEVIVVDLTGASAKNYPEEPFPEGVKEVWASCETGYVDPRPFVMGQVQDHFNRILEHGGVFVVVARPREEVPYSFAELRHGQLYDRSEFGYDNWSFLALLSPDFLDIQPDVGTEIRSVDRPPRLREIGSNVLRGRFSCTVRPTKMLKDSWITLATNKYGDPVAGAIDFDGQLKVIVVPRLDDISSFLRLLVEEVLPSTNPSLFPHEEGARWVNRPEYEIPAVLTIHKEIGRIQEEARGKVNELENQIAKIRHDDAYLYELLTGTDKALVAAVLRALAVIGFNNVVDVDALQEPGDKREDLRILDRSPALLVEVKGIHGAPKEASSLQVAKYLAPRMRQWSRIDIRGLAIINHERHKPGLDRTPCPFGTDVLTNAAQQEIGLMTAWDLYRLTRSFLENRWSSESVLDLFYRSGQIEPVPLHYELVGEIENYWDDHHVVGVRVNGTSLGITDRVGFEFPVEFSEQEISSLQVDRAAVHEAANGMLAAFPTKFNREQLKKGTRVFRVRKHMGE